MKTPDTDALVTAARPPPRWARWAAHAPALTTLPTGLWRTGMAFGLPLGYTDQALRANFDAPGWGSLYLIGLSVLLEGLALLTLGLVQSWGDMPPRWIPFIGGKPVRPWAVVIAAGTGAALLSLIWIPTAVLWWFVDGDGALTATARIVVGLLYMPMAAWGPLLAAVTVSYRRRHRR